MASEVPDIKPVISTVATINANPEGEMDALLLGRTRVSHMYVYDVVYDSFWLDSIEKLYIYIYIWCSQLTIIPFCKNVTTATW